MSTTINNTHVCVNCGDAYTCDDCAAMDAELELLVQHGVSENERLLPQGAECQCAECGWLFGGLTGFDRHVTSGQRSGADAAQANKSHADPLSLGLAPRFRSNAVVWVQEYSAPDTEK